MARPRKETTPKIPEDLSYARLAQIERAVGILSAYIVERDQLRYVGGDADIVGVAREFSK